MNPLQSPPAVDIAITTRGAVSSAAPDYARAKVRAVLSRIHEPVLGARVKLTQEAHHAIARPSLAQAVVDLDGRPVRAHVAAATMQEAVDLLQDRLLVRLVRARQRHHHAPHGAWVGSPRDEHRPQHVTRPPQERRIVRRKSYGLYRQSPPAAVLDLEAMDYAFHLFTDAATGFDAVVYRDERDGAHRIASTGPLAAPAPVPVPAPAPGLGVSTDAAPELTVAQAADRLGLTGAPFVFFTDRATGRGNVLYHRYDGHYGLITPAEE